jgi:hypothetical protein
MERRGARDVRGRIIRVGALVVVGRLEPWQRIVGETETRSIRAVCTHAKHKHKTREEGGERGPLGAGVLSRADGGRLRLSRLPSRPPSWETMAAGMLPMDSAVG